MSHLETVLSAEASGYDAKKETIGLMFIENLISGIARTQLRQLPSTSAASTYMPQKPSVITQRTVAGVFGRQFFMVPDNMKCNVYKLGYVPQDDNIDRIGQTTSIHPHCVFWDSNTATVRTKTSDTNTVPESVLNDMRAAKQTLSYIDIVGKDWDEKEFFAFILMMSPKTTGTASASIGTGTGTASASIGAGIGHIIKYMGFYKHDDPTVTSDQNRSFYLRNLMANNIILNDPNDPANDKMRYRFDRETCTFIETTPIQYQDTADDILLDGMPKVDLEESPIAPMVRFFEDSYFVFVEKRNGYKKLIFDYIEAYSNTGGITIINGVLSIDPTFDSPTKEYFIMDDKDNYLFHLGIHLSSNINNNTRRYRDIATCVVKHSCIGRIAFGSNGDWERAHHSNDDNIRTRGNGCLDNNVCKVALGRIGQNPSNEIPDSTWMSFIKTSSMNGAFCEMLGHTSNELASAFFEDADMFRSFSGTSMSYFDSIMHWIQTEKPEHLGRRSAIENKVKGIYKKNLSSWLLNIIGGLIVDDVDRIDERSNYIKILHEAHEFEGYSSRSAHKSRDSSKLTYSINHPKYNGANANRKNSRMIDGKLFITCDVGDYKRPEYTQTLHSVKSPYGYVARSMYRAIEMIGGSVKFFIASRVKTIPDKGTMVQSAHNCVQSKTSLYFHDLRDPYLTATPTEYFPLTGDSNVDDNMVAYKSYLFNLDKIWELYIYTQNYIYDELFLILPSKEFAANNREFIFAIELARLFRLEHSDKRAVNIYDLLPYRTIQGTDSRKRKDVLKEYYPKVMQNVYFECDLAYKSYRLNAMWELHEKLSSEGSHFTPLEKFTNVDYVNGFLLATDFSQTGFYTYMSRGQYLAMSASVIYARDNINEEMVFMTDSMGKKLKSEHLSTSAKGSAHFPPDHLIDSKSVVSAFKNTSLSVYANIANVPIYNTDDGKDVFVSTLNETLSINSTLLYMIMRTCTVVSSSEDSDRLLHFDFILGKEYQANDVLAHNAIQEAHQEFARPEESVPVAISDGAPVWEANLAERLHQQQRQQDTVLSTNVVLVQGDIIANITRRFREYTDYITRTERSKIAIEEASHNRRAIENLPPRSNHHGYTSSLFSFYDMMEKATIEGIAMGRRPEYRPDQIAANKLRSRLTELHMQ